MPGFKRTEHPTEGNLQGVTEARCPKCDSTNVWAVMDTEKNLFMLRCEKCSMESDVKRVKGFIKETMAILKIGSG